MLEAILGFGRVDLATGGMPQQTACRSIIFRYIQIVITDVTTYSVFRADIEVRDTLPVSYDKFWRQHRDMSPTVRRQETRGLTAHGSPRIRDLRCENIGTHETRRCTTPPTFPSTQPSIVPLNVPPS